MAATELTLTPQAQQSVHVLLRLIEGLGDDIHGAALVKNQAEAVQDVMNGATMEGGNSRYVFIPIEVARAAELECRHGGSVLAAETLEKEIRRAEATE